VRPRLPGRTAICVTYAIARHPLASETGLGHLGAGDEGARPRSRSVGALEAQARAVGLDVRPLVFGGDRPGAILGLARLLQDAEPDVVHTHDPHATGAVATMMVSGRRPRLVAGAYRCPCAAPPPW
jgi:hypothetical protein